MPRFIKQFLYGIFYLGVFALIAFGVYVVFLRPGPSCTNNRQDAGEEDVDCGGVCSPVCFPQNFRPIEVTEQVRIFYPANGQVSALATIQNANAGLAVKAFDYSFDFYDAQNNLLRTVSGQSFIYAGEIRRLAKFLDITESLRVVRVDIRLQNAAWVKAEAFPRPEVVIQDWRAETDGSMIRVNGRFVNAGTLLLPYVTILAIFHNASGRSMGISETAVEDVAPRESKNFTIFYPAVKDIDPKNTELIASASRE